MTGKVIDKQYLQNVATVVHRTVETFPIGSPIIVDDIRFAAKVDGYNLDDVDGQIIAMCLAEVCDHKAIRKDARASWYRRENA